MKFNKKIINETIDFNNSDIFSKEDPSYDDTEYEKNLSRKYLIDLWKECFDDLYFCVPIDDILYIKPINSKKDLYDISDTILLVKFKLEQAKLFFDTCKTVQIKKVAAFIIINDGATRYNIKEYNKIKIDIDNISIIGLHAYHTTFDKLYINTNDQDFNDYITKRIGIYKKEVNNMPSTYYINFAFGMIKLYYCTIDDIEIKYAKNIDLSYNRFLHTDDLSFLKNCDNSVITYSANKSQILLKNLNGCPEKSNISLTFLQENMTNNSNFYFDFTGLPTSTEYLTFYSSLKENDIFNSMSFKGLTLNHNLSNFRFIFNLYARRPYNQQYKLQIGDKLIELNRHQIEFEYKDKKPNSYMKYIINCINKNYFQMQYYNISNGPNNPFEQPMDNDFINKKEDQKLKLQQNNEINDKIIKYIENNIDNLLYFHKKYYKSYKVIPENLFYVYNIYKYAKNQYSIKCIFIKNDYKEIFKNLYDTLGEQYPFDPIKKCNPKRITYITNFIRETFKNTEYNEKENAYVSKSKNIDIYQYYFNKKELCDFVKKNLILPEITEDNNTENVEKPQEEKRKRGRPKKQILEEAIKYIIYMYKMGDI